MDYAFKTMSLNIQTRAVRIQLYINITYLVMSLLLNLTYEDPIMVSK